MAPITKGRKKATIHSYIHKSFMCVNCRQRQLLSDLVLMDLDLNSLFSRPVIGCWLSGFLTELRKDYGGGY